MSISYGAYCGGGLFRHREGLSSDLGISRIGKIVEGGQRKLIKALVYPSG
jgi:hypothetical protein